MAEKKSAGSTNDIFDIINERQQISLNELSDIFFSMGLDKERLSKSLSELESTKLIASTSRGGVLTYYPLQEGSIRKVLIVEDDKNINKLMALSIGKGFDDKPDLRRWGGDSIGQEEQARPCHT